MDYLGADRRQNGYSVTFDFHDRENNLVSATAFFIRGKIRELVYSFAPHWLACNEHFS